MDVGEGNTQKQICRPGTTLEPVNIAMPITILRLKVI